MWTTSQVAVSPAGDARVADVTRRGHDAARQGLELMLRHYLATGTMIDRETLHRQLDAEAPG